MRLPEVRHNLRLITESCKVDLDGLAREAKALVNRGNWIQNEDPKLRRKIESEADRMSYATSPLVSTLMHSNMTSYP